MAQGHQFAALDVDLDHVDAGGLGDVVEAMGGDLLSANHLSPLGKAMEQLQDFAVRREQRGHARRLAEVQRVTLAVPNRVGEVGFGWPLHLIELRQGDRIGLEADDVGVTGAQQLFVGRDAVQRIGANVDDLHADIGLGQ